MTIVTFSSVAEGWLGISSGGAKRLNLRPIPPQEIELPFSSRFYFFQLFLLRKNGFFILSCTLVSVYSGSVYGQRCGQIRVPNDSHVVMIFGWQKRPKIAPPTEKKCIENRKETHQLLYVVNLILRDDKHVVRTIRQPRTENCFASFCRCCIVTQKRKIVKPLSQ